MKLRKALLFLAILGLVFYGFGNGYAQLVTNEDGEIVEVIKDGTINWTTNRVEAKGAAEKDQSLFKQKVSAEVRARTNLLKVLDGVHIKSERIVRDGRLKGEISTENVEGFLKHSRVTEPGTNSLGLLEVTAYVNIDKNGRSILLAPTYFQGSSDEYKVTGQTVKEIPAEYTGLIIDASGLPARPAMLPRFFAESGTQELYVPRALDREFIIENGYCAYAGSLEKAKKVTDRIGTEPLVVKAVKVSENGIDFIVKNEDAIKILNAEKKSGILSNSRIMIVVNTSIESSDE
ncbi:hypothetical protein C6A36_00645 [Desulfobacteraceae bacterium SEEP-SAG10]|nr:hypothetical protein C6A36_00645 [Desulfobacteraceae bacterium SEEP-SAG10]